MRLGSCEPVGIFGPAGPRLPVRFDELYDVANSGSSITEPIWREDSIKERTEALGETTNDFKQSARNKREHRFTCVFRALK